MKSSLLYVIACLLCVLAVRAEVLVDPHDDSEASIATSVMVEMMQDAQDESTEPLSADNEASPVTIGEAGNGKPTDRSTDPETQAPSATEQKDQSAKEHTASGFARPRTSLKDVPQKDSASYREAPRQEAFSAPAPNQGAYYGTQETEPKEQPAGPRKQSAPTDSSSGGGERSSGPAPKLTDIANMLNRKVSLDQLKQKQEAAARLQRQRRFSVSRSHAAPVERVLEAYNDPKTNLYDVLGVRRGISDAALRKAYRSKALAIHPDKNPHPDAKDAFDALQEAYDAISTPSKRAEYDEEVTRRERIAKAKRWNARRIKKWVSDTATNWKSSLQLFHHEITHIEGTPGPVSAAKSAVLLWGKVRAAAAAMWRKITTDMKLQLEHYVLLPSALDRLQLLHEQMWRQKWQLLLSAALCALLRR